MPHYLNPGRRRARRFGRASVRAMRALLQRVQRAHVTVGDELVGQIGEGLVAFVGVTHTDEVADADKLADRIAGIRIMDDDEGVMNRSVVDTGGAVLVVSQFTLYGETSKGRRPSWSGAAKPDVAEPLIDRVVQELQARDIEVATGRFRADMVVEIINDGPCTVMVEVP